MKTNLIGLNGRMESGKDTVAKIWLYLSSVNEFNKPFNEWCEKSDDVFFLEDETIWDIRKFAGSLKQIASILTNIPTKKFEDQKFKNSFLGNEWSAYQIQITDHRSDTLMPKYTELEYFYNKNEAEIALNKTNKRLKLKKFKPEEITTKIVSTKMRVRELLQRLGTEAVRNGLHQNAWINAAFAEYKPSTYEYSEMYNKEFPEKSGFEIIQPHWIFSDMRFENEAQSIVDRKGKIIRILRPKTDCKSGNHPSETSLDSWKFDYTIINNGSIEDLIKKTKEIYDELS